MGNKGRLVNSQNRSGDDWGAGKGGVGGGGLLFLTASARKTLMRVEAKRLSGWKRRLFCHMGLRPRCVKFGELTELLDV